MIWSFILSLWICAYPLTIYTKAFPINTKTQHLKHNNISNPQDARQPTESILIFISLNLPDETLRNLYHEAKTSTVPARLFLKALYKGSLQISTKRLKALNIKVKIDPEWLDNYEIQSVPTFIFLKKQKTPIILHGNMSLAFAIEQINKKTPL